MRPLCFGSLSPVQPDLMTKAATVLSIDLEEIEPEYTGDLVADRLVEMMRDCEIPNGLMGLGFTEEDIDALTEKTMPQRRLLDNAPMILEEQHIRGLFRRRDAVLVTHRLPGTGFRYFSIHTKRKGPAEAEPFFCS